MLAKTKLRLRDWYNRVQFPIDDRNELKSHSWTRRQESIAAWVLYVATFAVLLPSLSYPLIEPDETRYAQIAIEMIDSGDWVTPTLAGKPYLDKPPLMYWLTAASIGLLGPTEFSSRLPAVLSAMATVGLVFVLGRRIVGARAAWLGAMSLLLCGGFVIAGRFLILDSLLAFFVVLSLLAGYLAVREERHRWAWWVLSGSACALGVLTKGPVSLLLCAPPLVASGWLRRDQSRVRLVHWAAFVVPMFLVCVPWYVAVWKSNPDFGDYFFLEHNLNRFTKGSNHRAPFWFYVPTLFAAMFPTSLLLPSLGVFLFSRSDQNRRLRTKDLGYLACASVWILAFFSFASCKLPTYILPALPMISLMMGVMLDQTVFQPQVTSRITSYLRPFPQRASLILVFTLAVVASVDVWYRGHFDAGTVVAGFLGIGVIAVVMRSWNRDQAFNAPAWAFTACVAFGVLSFTTTRFIPVAATERSILARVAALTPHHPTTPVVFFGENPHAAKLQLPIHTVIHCSDVHSKAADRILTQHDEMIVVVNKGNRDFVRNQLKRQCLSVDANGDDVVFVARRVASQTSHQANIAERNIR
ncbi:Undecaprenyl phosphate-alpha-4-amino-4-deoxy-L-arabinose arabinosyl transferase [Rubripirellula tenax]|uniref:Undecaprenyl phosphate-alpha-4-amino-4-deoxy-L-arabinose arabinosyl transferase n=1 Tax=Rubripirellula tenax TaxID=2528015 RepID=A0A5C6FHR7_9BACT|nr:glycosyltransferase family 39 protein [Rubripirellula tenax]TWU59747.1 Undecaprenyl phosphate-alpha-4-amino-4-deoxy-L-arabinose arabinosyl transferase [Rubripirellula tenax]